jgi:ATP-dependent Lon protease
MSFSALISDVNPDPRDAFIVKDILRDYSYGGKPNYYADYKKTAWSLDVVRAKISIAEIEKTLNQYEINLRHVDERFELSRLPSTDEKYKPLTNKEKKDLENTYAQAIDGTNELTPILAAIKEELNKAEIQEYAEMKLGEHLRRVRDEYFINKDLDALRKGVTWAVEMGYKLRNQTRDPYVEQIDLTAW